jgi:hypothetical protein
MIALPDLTRMKSAGLSRVCACAARHAGAVVKCHAGICPCQQFVFDTREGEMMRGISRDSLICISLTDYASQKFCLTVHGNTFTIIFTV